MNKHGKGLLTLLLVVILFIIAIVGAARLASAYLTQSSGDATCTTTGHAYTVTIRGGIVTPLHTDARLCDTLTITNFDATQRLIAFGEHENHTAYDGITERFLSTKQSLTVTLVQPGTYLFHDHLNDAVQGTFSVSRY